MVWQWYSNQVPDDSLFQQYNFDLCDIQPVQCCVSTNWHVTTYTISFKYFRSCVLKAFTDECCSAYPRSIPSMHRFSINTSSTLHWQLCWHSTDTPLTSQLTVSQESTNFLSIHISRSTFGWLYIQMTDCWSTVDRVLTNYCLWCPSSIEMLTKGINRKYRSTLNWPLVYIIQWVKFNSAIVFVTYAIFKNLTYNFTSAKCFPNIIRKSNLQFTRVLLFL